MKQLMHILLVFLLALASRARADKPNIVVILSDDAGFEEFGVYGVKQGVPSNTPHIDRLAERGVAFATCWGQAICGPSRAMFITGTYAVHNGAYDNNLQFLPGKGGRIKGRKDLDRLPHFTRILHDAGYAVAVGGKWHNPSGPMVLDDHQMLGLDSYCVWNASPAPFEQRLGHALVPDDTWEIAALSGEPKISRYWKPGIIRNDQVLPTTMQDYGPDIFCDFICDFMEDQAGAGKPFLAYYTQVLPHGAHCPTPDIVAEAGMEPTNQSFKKSTDQGMKMFLGQVNYADKLVGKIVATIEALGIADNTIIFYSSDNGTTSSSKGKGVEYGVHVPFVVAGAGIQRRGMTRELMDFTDVLPTLVDFAGASIPGDKPVDGISLKPFLTGESETTKPVIYSFPGPTRLVRTKEFMLEAVCPLYGREQGRFYRTQGSFDGRGYENVTHNPEFAAERARFQALLEMYPARLPSSWDDPVWKEPGMNKGHKHFTNPKIRQRHLALPTAYRFYDESF